MSQHFSLLSHSHNSGKIVAHSTDRFLLLCRQLETDGIAFVAEAAIPYPTVADAHQTLPGVTLDGNWAEGLVSVSKIDSSLH